MNHGAVGVLFLGLLALAPALGAFAAAAERPEIRLVGKSLAEALGELQSLGLEIFYTSHLVHTDMTIAEEPQGFTLEEVLGEILAPFDLGLAPGPGGRLVVVKIEPVPVGISGVARERSSATPIPGVRVVLPGAGREGFTDAEGRFTFVGLAPGIHAVEAHLPGFVIHRREVEIRPRQIVEVVIDLEAAPLSIDEIVVTPSRVSLLREDPVTSVDLDRDQILALPHLGDDIFRALTLLPGISGEEASARFNVRGGRDDEVLVLLDRVELFEPYHLKDFGSSQSIITPRALREVHLLTGGFPAEYGDRMSGVLDMSTVQPSARRFHLDVGILGAEVGGAGNFNGERGHWLASFRRGFLDLALDFLGEAENPKYWDAFGKAEMQLGSGQLLGLNVLHSDDSLDFDTVDEETSEAYLTSYGNSYLWLTHQAPFGSRLFVESVASAGRVNRDRRGAEVDLEDPGDSEEDGEPPDDEDEAGGEEPEAPEGFSIFDDRKLDVLGLKQSWNYQARSQHYWKWGFDVRHLEATYDYLNLRELEDFLAEIRSEPRTGTTRFVGSFSGDQISLYTSDRYRPRDDLTVELGLRYDEQSLTGDRNLSPRLNLVFASGGQTTWRLAWGHFYQSQRPYELQVEDGVSELVKAERTENRVLGLEHTFVRPGRASVFLRLEAYQRLISDPRIRFENLFEPASLTSFPEIEPDRFVVRPDRSEAYGIELFLRGSWGPRVDWWLSYAHARTFDRIDGAEVPRRIDQPNTFNIDFNFHLGREWNLNLAWRYHSGWPTTAISGRIEVDEEGREEIVPVFGPINGERLPEYHRLDLRLSKEWQLRRGSLGFFVELQNLYDRPNIAGLDLDFDYVVLPSGQIEVVATEKEIWGAFLPSFGITWEF